jgi:shikimate kinase
MGCGKSSVARHLAGLMDCAWTDLDAEIERTEKLTVPEIFARCGEPHFRAVEKRALQVVLENGSGVVAAGGGLFVDAENRDTIRSLGGTSVFLDVPWPILEERLVAAPAGQRPLFADPTQARELFDRRLPCYRKADLIMTLDGGETPAQAASLVHGEIVGAVCVT